MNWSMKATYQKVNKKHKCIVTLFVVVKLFNIVRNARFEVCYLLDASFTLKDIYSRRKINGQKI